MDKNACVDLFNAKVDEFLKDLLHSFPHINQFQQFKTGFMFMKNVDKNKPIDVFNDYIFKEYGLKIKERNEDFFLHTNYEIKYSSRVEYWKEFIDNLKNIWLTLDNDNKNIIWSYLQILVKINEKYNKI